jgi:hypothetical protein
MGQLNTDLSYIFKDVLHKWHVQLAEGIAYRSCLPHEFSKPTKTLVLAANCNTKVQNQVKTLLGGKPFWDGISFIHTPQNMLDIAENIGVEIKRTPHFCYIRDYFLVFDHETAVSAYFSPFLEQAVARTQSSNIYLGRTAAVHTTNQFFNTWSGYTNSYNPTIYHEQDKILKNPQKKLSYSYFEGGNVFILKNLNGVKSVLLGLDHFTQTFHLLELEKRSWDELGKQVLIEKSYKDVQTEIAFALTTTDLKTIIREMFSQGLIEQAGKSGLIPKKNQLDMMLMKFFSAGILHEKQNLKDELFNQMKKGMINVFEYQDQESQTYRTLASEYLAKLKITRELIAQDFNVQSENLHFITQVNYHLDLFLTPGPNNSLFLANYAICTDFLEAIYKNSAALALSKVDLEYLERYIESSKKMDREIGGLLQKVEEQLKIANFKIIPTPGHLIYESKTVHREFPMPSGGFNANFMNAITGKSFKTGRHYYITHGIQVGEQLGNVLMDSFYLFLKHYVPDLDVYFIGKDPKNSRDFSEAMDWWNRLETQSGIHCTTLEVEFYSPFHMSYEMDYSSKRI